MGSVRDDLGRNLPGAARPFVACPLSGRELDVLRLVSQGLTKAQVGEALGLSEHTVKTHLFRVARRLGTHNTTHAVATAIRSGWLP